MENLASWIWIRKRENETTHQKQPKGLAKGNSKKKKKLKKNKIKKWKTKNYLDTKIEKANKTTNILLFLIFIYTILFFKNVFYHCSILLSKIKFTY